MTRLKAILRWKYVAVIYILGLLVWFGALWAQRGYTSIRRGLNTAPMYARLVWQPQAPQAQATVLARSSATRVLRPGEAIGAQGTLRWQWILIDAVYVDVPPDQATTLRGIEYAFNPRCRNDAEIDPEDLTWHYVPFESFSATETRTSLPIRFSVPLIRLHRSLLPISAIRRSKNWAGDMRLAEQSMPLRHFPLFGVTLVGFMLLLAWGLRGLRSQAPDSTTLPFSGRQSSALHLRPTRTQLTARTGFVVLFIAVPLACFGPPVYEGGDEFFLVSLVAGYFHLPPSPMCLFINPLFAGVLYGLYQCTPHVPWHGLLLQIQLLLGLSLIVLAVSFSMLRRRILVLVAFYVLCSWYTPFSQAGFTLVAAISSVAGLLVFHWVGQRLSQPASTDGRKRLALLWAAGLMMLGSLYRFEAFLCMSAVILPWAVLDVALRCRSATGNLFHPRFRRLLTYVFVCLVICFAAHIVGTLPYKLSSKWRHWRAVHDILVTFNYRQRAFSEILSEATPVPGWTRPELIAAYNLYTLDPKFRSLTDLAKVATFVRAQSSRAFGETLAGLDSAVHEILTDRPTVLFPAAVCLVCGLGLWLSRSRYALWSLCVLCTWQVLLAALITVAVRPVPHRIFYPMVLACATVSIFFMGGAIQRGGRQITAWVVFGLLFGLAVCFLLVRAFESPSSKQRVDDFAVELRETFAGRETPVVIEALPGRSIPSLRSFAFLEDARGVFSNYLAATPPSAEARDRLSFPSAIAQLEKSGEVTFLMAERSYASRVGCFREYFSQRVGKAIAMELVRRGSQLVLVRYHVENPGHTESGANGSQAPGRRGDSAWPRDQTVTPSTRDSTPAGRAAPWRLGGPASPSPLAQETP